MSQSDRRRTVALRRVPTYALLTAVALLFLVAALICRSHDRRKAKKLAAEWLTGVGLDEASEIDPFASELDTTPSAPQKHDDIT